MAVLAAHQNGLGGEAIGGGKARLDGAVLRALHILNRHLAGWRGLRQGDAQVLRQRQGLVPRGNQIARNRLPHLRHAIRGRAPFEQDSIRGIKIHETNATCWERAARRR